MVTNEVSFRYAKALLELTAEDKTEAKTFAELRALAELFDKNKDIKSFLSDPIIETRKKELALAEALKSSGLSPFTTSFVLLLARRNRLSMLKDMAYAFESLLDQAHGVTRGMVRSAAVLSPEERTQIEQIVSRVTKKQVILSYQEDSELIGGLIAEVGSYTFDDSLSSHLRRLREDLKKRRTN